MTVLEAAEKPAYFDNYFSDFSPLDLRLALLSAGVRHRVPENFQYLELGFGTGLSLNIHAAAHPGEYWGNDYVPAHIDRCNALANASGAKLRVLLDSFDQLAKRGDLPQFDIIAAHGIWTWVGDKDRGAIVELLDRHLAPNGLFYISYNNTAGWADAIFLRQLMNLHLRSDAGAIGESMEYRISKALQFAHSLLNAGANYFQINPAAGRRVQAMGAERPIYLQHEYFTEAWCLASFAEVAGALQSAGLQFAASTSLVTHNDHLTLGPEGSRIVSSIADPVLRESTRECFIGWGFRQDVFIKGPVEHMSREKRRDLLSKEKFILAVPRASATLARSPKGDVDLIANGCGPILAALADDNHSPKTIAELQRVLRPMQWDELIDRIMLLAGASLVRIVQDEPAQARAKQMCDGLNAVLLSEVALNDELLTLASPVIGAGVSVGKTDKLYCRALTLGASSIEEMATSIIAAFPQTMSAQEALKEGGRTFMKSGFPILKALGIELRPDP